MRLAQENAIGGHHDDLLIADAFDSFLLGGPGNDVLVGHAGKDALFGGLGRDLLIGGIEKDQLSGGGDDDILIAGTTIYDRPTGARIRGRKRLELFYSLCRNQ